MKTNTLKTVCILVILISGLLASSFTNNKVKETTHSLNNNWEEYNKVREYVSENICTPLSEHLNINHSKSAIKYFGRCPSGYEPEIQMVVDSVRTNRFVNGSIVFYKGCTPNYVCHFKVFVTKGFAVVRSKGSKEYMSVNEWIKLKNENSKAIVKN